MSGSLSSMPARTLRAVAAVSPLARPPTVSWAHQSAAAAPAAAPAAYSASSTRCHRSGSPAAVARSAWSGLVWGMGFLRANRVQGAPATPRLGGITSGDRGLRGWRGAPGRSNCGGGVYLVRTVARTCGYRGPAPRGLLAGAAVAGVMVAGAVVAGSGLGMVVLLRNRWGRLGS